MSTKPSFLDRPKLRKIERFEDVAEGEARLILHDPLGVAEPVAVPLEYAGVLELMDGTRSVGQIRQSLRLRTALCVDREDLEAFVADLSSAGWLDDPVFRDLRSQQVAAFEGCTVRTPRWADVLYPADPERLRADLDAHLGRTSRTTPDSRTLGVLVPHGPPDLVGNILGRTLRDLPPPEALDLVVVLGTDHQAGLTPVTGTRRSYATPLGDTRLATSLLDALEHRVPWICREELRHGQAMSLELAHVYLQYVYGDALPPVLPLLCGARLLERDSEAAMQMLLGALEALVPEQRVFWYGSAELSHTGPAYGGRPLDAASTVAAEQHDRALLDTLGRGSSSSTSLREHCREASPFRPSGGAVMAMLVEALPVGFRAEVAAYERRAAPGSRPGHAGLAGVRFVRPC